MSYGRAKPGPQLGQAIKHGGLTAQLLQSCGFLPTVPPGKPYYYQRLCHVACGISVPSPGIELRALAGKAPSLTHWTAKEFAVALLLIAGICLVLSRLHGSLM